VVSVGGFRAAFPAFSDADAYPDARVEFWLGLAQKMLSRARWGSVYCEGAYLYAAHGLTVERRASGGAGGDGDAGSVGAVTSESQAIGGMSYSQSFDTSAYAGGGQMASTVYGQQYLDLVRVIGAGGVQL
jgi:hypothetical protein